MLNHLQLLNYLKTKAKGYMAKPRRIVSGKEIGIELNIDALICPLRYDILIRCDFFRFYKQEKELYEKKLPSFLNSPPVKDYYIWFKEVAIAKYEPMLYHDDNLIIPKFIDRVHKSAALWESIEADGLDTANPIRLNTAKVIHSVNGIKINTQYYAGDGCHRLACLYVNGVMSLKPQDYVVVIHDEFEPLNNTAILFKKLPLSTADYYRFISRYYCNGLELATGEEILQYTEAYQSGLLSELRSIIATIN